ncbi:MAG: hypothetical protein FJ271_14760 [Planctomycetes bacterium]|nr:hypothetical protein [Planctomycetota bacterium]
MLHRRCGLLAVSLLFLGAVAAAPAADSKYLPDNAEVILTVNFKQIMDSELVKAQKDAAGKVKAMVEDKMPPEAQKWLKKAGIDLFTDLGSVTVALPAKKDPKDAVFAIIEGSFQPEKIFATAAEAVKEYGEVLKITRQGQQQIIEVQPPQGEALFVTLAGKDILFATTNKTMLTAALARAAGEKQSKLKKEVRSLLEATNGKQSISAVATGRAIAKLLENAQIPPQQAQMVGPVLKSIEGLSAAITITKDVQFQIGVGTKDAETAANLAKGATFGLTLVKGMLDQKAMEDAKLVPLVDIVKTLRVNARNNSVMFQGQATLDNIDKLIKNFHPQ